MSKKIKKSRKAIQLYTFNNTSGESVDIDLNNYTAKCSVTGEPKKFYHSYLANLIQTKYDNNISTFEMTYVSRSGRTSQAPAKKATQLQTRIDRMYDQIKLLKAKKAELVS